LGPICLGFVHDLSMISLILDHDGQISDKPFSYERNVFSVRL